METSTDIVQTIAEEIAAQSRQVACGDCASGRRRHCSLHRPLPQGSDRRARRHATAQAGRTAHLSAGTGIAPRRHRRVDPVAGQADRRAGTSASQAAKTKSELEDIYLPYKPKRRTKAMIARENGLEPLLDADSGRPCRRARGACGGLSSPRPLPAIKDALERCPRHPDGAPRRERGASGRAPSLHEGRGRSSPPR